MQNNPLTDDSPIDAEFVFSVTASDTARYTMDHMSRKSKAYMINDNELESLEDIETHTAAGWSGVAFCVGQIIIALWDVGYTPEGVITFAWGWVVFWGLVGIVIGKYTLSRRGRRENLVARIKRESANCP